jgi:hypothetical protein
LTEEQLDKDMDRYWKGKKEAGNLLLTLEPRKLQELDNDLEDYFKARNNTTEQKAETNN